MRRVASVSIDVDPLACYYRIHALGQRPSALADVVLQKSLPRFKALLARHGVKATFFVVASDVDGPSAAARSARALLRDLVAAGHEIASHSHAHAYDMARWAAPAAREEIDKAHRVLADAAGVAPVGFRAPGYDLSPAMLDALASLGYSYDSSIFPAPAYYTAKLAVMTALTLLGRPSGAVLTNPKALLAPTEPYRPHPAAPWRRGQSSLVELPITVTPGLRVPAIGTYLLTVPAWLRRRILASISSRSFFNFELHGIDLVDAEEDGIPAELVAVQPDLRVPLATKQQNFAAVLAQLSGDYTFAPLREVASRVQREGKPA